MDADELWGPPTQPVPMPAEQFAPFADRAPDHLLDLWREFGASGFRDGLTWLWNLAIRTDVSVR